MDNYIILKEKVKSLFEKHAFEIYEIGAINKEKIGINKLSFLNELLTILGTPSHDMLTTKIIQIETVFSKIYFKDNRNLGFTEIYILNKVV